MFYSIIFPLLIVLSVFGIILFLMKKGPEAERLSRQEKMNFSEGATSRRSGAIKNFFLAILEKITRRSRLFFLKIDNFLTDLASRIRDKRKRASLLDLKESQSEEKEGILSEEDILGKGESYQKGFSREISDGEYLQNRGEKKDSKEIFSDSVSLPASYQRKPRFSQERAISPAGKMREAKSKLEEALIERIAINPKDIEAYERLGEYYLEIDNLEYSKECFKQVIKLDPRSRNAKAKLRKLERLIAR